MAKAPEGLSREQFIAAVDHAIRARRTRKVFAGSGWEETGSDAGRDASPAEVDGLIRDAIEVAGWAPFHFASSPEVPEPWRFVVVDRPNLDRLTAKMGDLLVGKLPKIFGGAAALVQITWIPEADPDKGARIDWEHAAAAASAAQNLLLAAEARGLGTYWCSAGPLMSEGFFELLGIDSRERYMGTLVLGKPLADSREETDGFQGKLRRQRSTAPEAWSRWVEIEG